MDLQKRIIESVSEIGKVRIGLGAYERQLETAGEAWFDELFRRVGDGSDEAAVHDAEVELTSVVESLREVTGSPNVNELVGRILSMLVKLELLDSRSRKVCLLYTSPSPRD